MPRMWQTKYRPISLLSSKEAEENLRGCLRVSGADIADFVIERAVSPQEIAMICGLHEFQPLVNYKDAIRHYKEKNESIFQEEKTPFEGLNQALPMYALVLDALGEGRANLLAHEILKLASFLGFSFLEIDLLKCMSANDGTLLEAIKGLEALSLSEVSSIENRNYVVLMPNVLELDQTLRAKGDYPKITKKSIDTILFSYPPGTPTWKTELLKGFIRHRSLARVQEQREVESDF